MYPLSNGGHFGVSVRQIWGGGRGQNNLGNFNQMESGKAPAPGIATRWAPGSSSQ